MSESFRLHVAGDGIAELVFDSHDDKVNKFSQETLLQLEKVIEEAAANHSIRALILRSGKEGMFIAGADLNTFRAAEHKPDLVVAIIETGHRVFNKLAALPFPTIALIDGTCLGGGTECALACTYRIATDNSKTSIGLPEVTLGIVPGWGGTERLPRLVGLQESLKMILSGKPVDGKKAFRIGLADAFFPTRCSLNRALEFARTVADHPLKKRQTLSFPARLLENNPLGRAILFWQSKKSVLKQTKGHYPAPLVALDIVRRTYSKPLAAGLQYEKERFIASLGKEFAVARHLVNLFFIQEALKKQMDGVSPSKQVEEAGVLGAGTMGGGIAWLFSYRDITVRMKDIRWDAVGQGYAAAKKIYNDLVRKKILPSYEADIKFHRIGGSTSLDGFKGVDLVVEAVVENLEVKRQVLKELEAVVDRTTVIGSNTSSLTIDAIGRDLRHPERFVGMHFFNPVNRMPLVEVVAGQRSSPHAVATVFELCKRLKKVPIVVGDCPGFLVNRIFMAGAAEIVVMLEEGVPMDKIESALLEFGLPMSPFLLLDEVGVDVAYKVSKTLNEAYGARMQVPVLLHTLIEKKWLGKKTGEGFYLHRGRHVVINPEIDGLLTKRDNPLSLETIQYRPLFLMVNEALRCLGEGIVTSAGAVDLAMIMGTGFPPYRGGLLRWAEDLGVGFTIRKLYELSEQFGDRFLPCDYLEQINKDGRRFYSKLPG